MGIALVALIAVSTLFATTNGDQVIVAGDSWGEEGWDYLQKVLKEHSNTADLKVKSYAKAGTTSADWIKPPTKLVDDINKNADAQYLWLTIGGNDAADYLPDCTKKYPLPDPTCINNILNVMINNTMIMLEPVVKQHPNLQIIQFGYDILNFHEGICSEIGKNIFHGCNDEPSCINPQFVKLQYVYIEAIKKRIGANYHNINLLGTLQMDDPKNRFPNVTVGNPDLNAWSPSDLIQENCIHPTRPEGFTDVFNEMYELYWKNV